MRSQFKINHETSNIEVQTQIRWLAAHPSYIRHLIGHCEPYIYHIVHELKTKNLPGEIAIIPMLESAYDPFAYSGSGAAGLWQIMPNTGSHLGLKKDWWYDGRKGIGPSTNAALNYLARLNQMFNGNWLLAIAAYDAGEGTVAKAIKASGQNNSVNFWALPISRETKLYIPRLLAIAEIISNPNRYGISLPPIAYSPYFEEVNVGSQIHLDHAAHLAGISYQDIKKLNPQFTQTTTAPTQPFKLLIPADKVDDFARKLALIPVKERMSMTSHKAHPGDKIDTIAKQYHTTPDLIKELNELESNSIKKHQIVLVPGFSGSRHDAPQHLAHTAPKASQTSSTIYIVKKGDTLLSIAKAHHQNPQQIKSMNHLDAKSHLKIGQKLNLPAIARPQATANTQYYTIKRGDSLSKIARQSHIPLKNLQKLNPTLNAKRLKPGQRIRLA